MKTLDEARALVVTISSSWEPGMTTEQIYEAARGIWKIDPGKHNPDYVIAVANGRIRGVYEVRNWQPASAEKLGVSPDDRWEFNGSPAVDLSHVVGQESELIPGFSKYTVVQYLNC